MMMLFALCCVEALSAKGINEEGESAYKKKQAVSQGSITIDFPFRDVFDADRDGVMEPVLGQMWSEPDGKLIAEVEGYDEKLLNYYYLMRLDHAQADIDTLFSFRYWNVERDSYSYYIGDIDNDGRTDMLAESETIIYTQQPDGSFIAVQPKVEEVVDESNWSGSAFAGYNLRESMFVDSESNRYPDRPCSAMDLNNDGVLDIINRYGLYYSMDGIGSYFYIRDNKHKYYPYDIDGDGVLDFVCYDGKSLYIVTDVINPNTEPNVVYQNSAINDVLFRDFDHDGDIDILAFLYVNTVSYFVFLRNNGDGSFRRKEVNFADTKYSIISCGDYDADGCYELLLDKTSKSQSLECDLMKVNVDFTMTHVDELKYIGDDNRITIKIGDFNNDGRTEIYTNKSYWDKSVTSESLVSQTLTNTAPKKMAMPTAMLQPENNRLKISWQRGEDAETSACDLTYEVRIGTQPGLGDVMQPQSLPDGRRQTIREGRQGTRLNTLFNAEALTPGKYYISVQAIDAGGLGGAFSDELVYEHGLQTPVFTMSSKNIASADTLEVSVRNYMESATYEWSTSEGEVISQQGCKAQILFHRQGEHEVGLTMTLNGITYQAEHKKVYVSPMKRWEQCRDVWFDVDQDGFLDALNSGSAGGSVYKNNGDGTFEQILLSTFADLKGQLGFVTDFNRDGYPDFTIKNCSKGDVFLNYGEQDFDFDYQTVGMNLMNYSGKKADLNNDGLLDLYKEGSSYPVIATTDGINYVVTNINIKSSDNYFYDVNRDGLLDIVYYEYQNVAGVAGIYKYRFYCMKKDHTADFTYSEPELMFEFSVEKVLYSPAQDPVQIADLNNDGYVDLIMKDRDFNLYIYAGTDNWPSTELTVTIQNIFQNYSQYQHWDQFKDINNDGILDWPFISMNGSKTLYFHSDFSCEIVDYEGVDEGDIFPFSRQGDIQVGNYVYKTGIDNASPQAPATVAAKQTKDGLLITWSDALDDHTPAMQMRYNVSVKRKGKTGKNAFVISPMNGLKDEAAIVPGYDYKKSTQMIVPASVLTVGETYEIQVQSIDLWGAHSPMTKAVEFTMAEGGYIDVAERVATGKEVTVKYQGAQVANYSLDAGSGGTIVENKGGGEFVVRWNTSGVKELTMTAGTKTLKSQVTVENVIDLGFSLPSKIYAGAPVAITLTDDMVKSGLPVSMRVYYNKRFDAYYTAETNLKLEYSADGTQAFVTFPSTGTYYVEAVCGNSVRGGSREVTVTVSETMPEASISRVDWDDATGRYCVQWDASQWSGDIEKIVVLKEGTSLNHFTAQDTLDVSKGQWIDPSSAPAVKSERYQIQLIAKNGQVSRPATAHRPLHVMLLTSGSGGYNLMWDRYEGIDVDNYQVWRKSGNADWQLLAQVAGSQQSYTDLTAANEVDYLYSVEFAPLASSRGSVGANPVSARAAASTGEDAIQGNVVSTASAIKAVMAESISVICNDDNLTLNDEHPSLQFFAVVKPTYCTVSQVEWSIVEGNSLATITADGRLTKSRYGSGTVKVQARTIDGSNVSATVTFNVEGTDICDVNCDGSVDVADISAIINVMAAGANDAIADVNNDGAVDVADISAVIVIMAEQARQHRAITEKE